MHSHILEGIRSTQESGMNGPQDLEAKTSTRGPGHNAIEANSCPRQELEAMV